MSDVKELQRLIDLKNSQLAECTRVMREVADALLTNAQAIAPHVPPIYGFSESLTVLAQKLSNARAGKVAP